MATAFFNLEVKKYNYHPSNWTAQDVVTDNLEKFSNLCFAPSRYLFKGKTLHLEGQLNSRKRKYFHFKEESFQEHTWSKAIIAHSLFIPGLILGTLPKSLTRFCPGLNGNQIVLNNLQQQSKTPKPFPGSITLGQSHKALDDKAHDLLMRMNSREIWKDPSFICEVSEFMEAAYKEIKIYYSQLTQEAAGNPQEMAKIMVTQQRNPNYCYPYFYNSLTDMYHLARGCVYFEKRDENEITRHGPLSRDDEKPYFTPGTEQWRWRMLYNKFCNKLDDYGLRDFLDRPCPGFGQQNNGGDDRFGKWSKPDLTFEGSYYPPSTRPT